MNVTDWGMLDRSRKNHWEPSRTFVISVTYSKIPLDQWVGYHCVRYVES